MLDESAVVTEALLDRWSVYGWRPFD
jgi:hypothetical protein